MLSTLVLASAAFADDVADIAAVFKDLESPPAMELEVNLGKFATCPGAKFAIGNIHTMAQMKATFQNSCDEVATEIKARAQQQSGWVDPHNAGHYKLYNVNGNMITTTRQDKNRIFTDAQTFSLQDSNGGCVATICSESQGTSANDAGTNMCNMFNLFCNSGEMNPQTGVHCKPIQNDLQYQVNEMDCGRYVGTSYLGHKCEPTQATCLKVNALEHQQALEVSAPVEAELAVTLQKYSTCPGARFAAANIHTMAQMSVNFQSSCDMVSKEITSRAQMTNGWADPHNNGKYKLISGGNTNMITTTRSDHRGIFTDKQTFALQSTSNGGCQATICSESQGTSANDAGTNLCNMFNLFCSADEMNQQTGVACKSIENDLQYNIQQEQCGRYVGQQYLGHKCENAQQTCLKNPSMSTEELAAPELELKWL